MAAMPYTLTWIDRISKIPRQEWNALALPLKSPLLEWEWLHLLEESGSVRVEVGWLPCHLTVRSGSRLVAAAALYIKGHSQGEFVFDHGWSNVADELGIRYYPKMVGMSPFSPVVGYRFLMETSEDAPTLTRMMLGEIDRFCLRNRIAGCSFLFVDPAWRSLLESLGYVAWRHQSFIWKNDGFRSFTDYLAVFNTNQRRNIRRERQSMERMGIEIKALTGDDIPTDHFGRMYAFYAATNDKFGPWGCKYLTPAFFEGLADRYRHRLVLMAAVDGSSSGPPMAMALLLQKGERLYGRYWGSSAEINHLHFNACYYRPIEWAIEHNIRRYDPGAGSSHKVRRGFAAVANHSLHRFYDPRMAQILSRHIGEINRLEQRSIDALNDALPFAKHRSESSPRTGSRKQRQTRRR
jgi:predicted N-acyltransferase